MAIRYPKLILMPRHPPRLAGDQHCDRIQEGREAEKQQDKGGEGGEGGKSGTMKAGRAGGGKRTRAGYLN